MRACRYRRHFLQVFQFNLEFDRSLATKSTSVQAGLIMDLNFTRTSSVFNSSQGSNTQRHSLYGSMDVDRNNGTLFLSNREEIDKGGVDVLLFVDNNNNGVYDAGDELIPAKGIKVDGMGKIELGRDSIIHVSQLQSYYRYNLEIDRQQIDPNLVPTNDKFSFVVDPNQFRRIEIPFYRGGTVSGTVYLDNQGVRTPMSGARVIMRSTHRAWGDTLHTFSDGGFYTMNVAPGNYTLMVDPTQLQFLQAVQKDGPLSVTVHHSLQGDIIDTLEIVLVKLAPKINLKAEDNVQKLASRLNDEEAKQAAEKQKADSVKEAAKAAMPAARPMIEMKKTESMETPAKIEIAMAEYKDAFGALKSGKKVDAAAILQKMLDEKVPDEIADHCHYWIGEIKYTAKKYKEALQEFNEVLTFDTWVKRWDAQLMIGLCYERMGDKEKAREAFEEVVKDNFMNRNLMLAKKHLARLPIETAAKTEIAMTEYEKAVGALKSKEYADAAAVFQKMLDKKVPDEIADHCHYWIGEINYASKKYNEALQEFNKVLTFDRSKKRGDAQFMIGLCYERVGNKEKARAAFEKVMKDYPMTANVKQAKKHLARL